MNWEASYNHNGVGHIRNPILIYCIHSRAFKEAMKVDDQVIMQNNFARVQRVAAVILLNRVANRLESRTRAGEPNFQCLRAVWL